MSSAWKSALAGMLVEAGTNAIGAQIAKRNMVAPPEIQTPNVDPEYQEYLNSKNQQSEQQYLDEYADKKLAEYLSANTKPKGQSKILNTSAGTVGLIIVVNLLGRYGIELSGEELALLTSAIAVASSAATYYFRRFKTNTLLK